MIPGGARLAGWLLIAATTAALVVALIIVGSPAQARKKSADEQRTNDLSQVVQMVRSYYVGHKKLPATLAECSWAGERAITDPQTGKGYEYRVLAKDRYELCATFETDTTKSPPSTRFYNASESRFGRHVAGRTCFILPGSEGS